MGSIVNRRRVMGNMKLPYDAEIEYLEGTGNGSTSGQVISSNILIPQGVTHVEYHAKFMFTSGNKGVLCGHQTQNYGNPRTYLFYKNNNSSNREFHVGNKISTTVLLPNNEIFEGSVFLDSETSEITVNRNGSILFSSSTSGEFLNRSVPIVFFGGIHGTSYDDLSSIRIWYFKIVHGTTVVRNFVPVRVGQVGYMYDKVSGKLFGNEGTGEFILGPDVK